MNPARAEERRRWVVDRMLEEGFIDAATHREAQARGRSWWRPSRRRPWPRLLLHGERASRLVELLGNEVLLQGGLVIETTLDAKLQSEAVLAVRRGLEAYDQRHGWRGALRRVKAAELTAEIEKVGKENGLEGGAEPTTTPLGPPRVGVVTGASSAAQEARIALAPDVEARFAFADAKWAQPEKSLAVGDVTHFRVSRDANGKLIAVLYQQPEVQGALLAIALDSDDVLALVGGYDFAASELDRCDPVAAPAGVGLQADRLHHRARARHDAGQHRDGQPGGLRRTSAPRTTGGSSWAR